jgi:hypothetical protein
VYVVQLAAHHRGQETAAAVGGGDPDPGHTSTCQRSARYRHLIRKDPRGANDLPAVEDRERPIELERLLSDGELFVGRQRSTKGSAEQREIGALLLGPNWPELKSCR